MEATFNELYGKPGIGHRIIFFGVASAVHQNCPILKLPTKTFSMSGLPEGIRLKHPSSRQLKAISDQKKNLLIHGKNFNINFLTSNA